MAETPSSSGAPVFPKLLPLPAIVRPVEVPVARPGDVKSAADLPSRLLLGDRVPGSFKFEKRGWSAEWHDADGHKTKFRYAGNLSSLELSFAGDEVVTLTQAEQFSDLGHTVQTLHPGAWLDGLSQSLHAAYNLRVFPHREDDAVGGGFPDGHLLSLVMPVPADRLIALFTLHKQLQQDSALRTPIDAYLRYGFSVVNYLEGRNHPMLAHPVGLVMHHVNALGTPAADLPRREEDEEGVAAWTLQRSHYLYIAHVYLRDLARFVERLAQAGFIAAADSQGEGCPASSEFGAVVLPFGYEYAAKNVWWFDKDRRRRMFYPSFADPDDRNQLAAGTGDIWARALLRDAEKMADQFKAETARAFAEGMAQGGLTPEAVQTPLH